MKRILREVLILGLPVLTLLFTQIEAKAQCPVVIDSVATTDVTCSGAMDGTLTIYITGGLPTYNYQIHNGAFSVSEFSTDTVHTFSGLSAGDGNYLVIIVAEDGLGGNCSAILPGVSVNEPAPFAVTMTITDEICPDSNDGEASVQVTGGQEPYTYEWPPFLVTDSVITGLDGGNYTVIITDSNGCTDTTAFTIASPPDWVGTLTGTNPTCFGDNDGSIASSGITGGTPPYLFSWTGTAQTTENISGLTAGSYTLTVTDALGCTFILPTVVLTTPPQIILTETHVDVSCDGLQDGSIDVTVSGGVGPYTYLWTNGAITQDLTGLASGNYILTATDAVGCSDNISVTILDGSTLNLTAISVSSECNEANGSIDLIITGGSGNYTFSWLPGSETTEDLANLAAGIYQVFVTDQTLGCIDSLFVIVNDFPGHDVTGTITNGSNCISDDGSIDVTVTGGSGDFSYLWSHSPTTEDVSGLATGVYFITVTDNIQGCVTIASFNVQSGNEVTITSSVTEPSCGLINGAIDLTVSGGTGPYTFLWSTGATTEDISGIGPGFYSVNILDINGCPFDTTFTLSNQGAPTVTATVVDPLCPGSNDGSISLVVSGGVGPFTYTWSNGGTTATILNLWAATYTVTIVDQGTGCTINESYTLTGPTGFNGFVDIQNESCPGAMDGFIDATVTGGTLPYSWLWNPGNFTTEDIFNLSAGVYTLLFSDANGCGFNGSFTITAPPALILSESHQDISCNGENDGSIDLTVSGGTPAYAYLWQPGGETTEDLNALGPGTYEVVVTDAAGCSDSIEVDILEPAVLVLNPSSTDATCNGTCDGTAGVAPTGGTAPYGYVWTPNVSSGPSATGLCAGNYSVIVTDANGCQDSAQFVIDDNQIQLTLVTTNVTCNGTCDGTGTATVTGSSPPFTYDWQPSGGNASTATGLCADNYTLTVTDATGCSVQEAFTILEPTPIVISMVVTDVSCEGGSDGAIDLTVTGGTGPYTYQWFPLGQTTEDISNLPAGDYSIVVTDANGCTSSTVTLGGNFTGGALALPDGTGASYETFINITGFPGGATLTDVNDFESICINIEHSWLSDLDIEFECPNGQTVLLEGSFPTGQIGAGVFLGDAADDEPDGVPGIGFVYCWTPNPTYGTMEAEAGLGNTVTVSDGEALPAGDYTPIEPLTNLLGCPLNGDWTITVTDNFAIDDGFIFDWGITLNSVGTNDTIATVNEPPPITITSTVTNAACGVCDGSITVVPAGGNAPYTYLWSNGATTATNSNLCAGVYNVQVTDANGCIENFFIPVDNTDGPTGSNTTITDASCFGTCDGQATVSGIGGTPPYTYQWVPGGFTTGTVTGLCAATYNVQIQDSLGCVFTEEVIIGEPAEINIGQSVVNSLCGLCTGEIELTPISGVAPFTYVWSPAVSTDSTATGLCAGVYNITVTDATGCETIVTSLVNDIPSPTLSISGIDPLCNDSCDGQAIVTPSGGTPPFTYLWDDPLMQTDSIASGLCAGLYTATVTDGNGCVAVSQVTLTEPDPIGLSLLVIDNGTCAGTCDGSLTVIPSGGTIPFTYQWNDPLAQTSATADSLCTGIYTVTVTDANGCTDTISGTVSNPVGLTAIVTTFDVLCNGDCDGWAYVTVTGGTPPYTYQWDDPLLQTGDTAVGLCAGAYTVTVTDANSCDFVVPFTITEPAPIIITFSGIVNLQCDGECIGEATADVTGGTAPYTYLWDDALAQNTPTADSLCASSYTVTVTDANGCTMQATVVITGPNGLTSFIVSQTNTSCNTACDGSAVVEGIGGTPPYIYQWNDPASTMNDTVNDLCAGIYSVTVTDANGCVSVSTVVIAEPDLLEATATAADASCFGECDGAATAFTIGGTFPYFYQWDDPNNQTTLTAIDLCPGPYTVTITDVNGCVATAPVEIFEPTEITIDTLVVNATCGLCNGEITVIPDGGVPPYTYLWGNNETTPTITNLCPGVYTVDVTDAIGCTVNFDIAVSNDGGPTSATVSVTDASCFGICDGTAVVTPVGGIPPYDYLWVPGGFTTDSVGGLCAGTYNVQISDSLGCIYTQLVTIAEPAEIEANANTTQATCGDCNGVIVLTPSGGDGGPYTYSWVPNVSTNDTASDLCVGVYTVTITDASGCETVETLPVSNTDGPVVTTSFTDVLCNGSCDGTATVHIAGGTPPFTVLWDDLLAQTDTTATGLCPGIYNATVTDANGCQFVAQVTIGEPDAISLSLQLVEDATCPGVCDGSAVVLASGGTLPFTYSWSPTGGNNASADSLCAGVYTVTVTDANGCTEQQTITISEPPAIVINTSTLDASCFGLCDGEAYAEATGGNGGFTYLWNDPLSTTNDTVTGLCAGTYTVFATDMAGCIDSAEVIIDEPDSIVVSITPTGVSCNGDCDGSAIAVASGGNFPYTYQWNDPNSTLNDTVTDLCAGIYSVVVTDSLGCIGTGSTVIIEPLPLLLLDSVVNVSCGGECDGIAGVLVQGGTPGYTYLWDDSNGQTTPFAIDLCAGTYQVVVTDANGCIDSVSVTITEPPVLEAPVTFVNASCGGECDGSATVNPTGGTPAYTIEWLPNGETTETIDSLCAGIYTVIVSDQNGCADTTVVTITEPPLLEAAITDVTQELCSGSCEGTATVTPTGGTPPYTYDWNDPGNQTDSTAIGLCVGIWSVTVTADIGCTATAVVAISDSAALVASVPIFVDVTCFGDCDGTATVFAGGGVGAYFYLWDDTFNQTTQTAIDLCPGTYTVTVTDSQSPACTTQASVTIGEPDELLVTAVATDVICGDVCDGTATATPTGGTPGYQYSWNDPANQNTPVAVDLCVGTYTVTITDANGCTVQVSATVGGPPEIVSNATSVAASCSNVANGSIDLTVVGGVPGYAFDWSPGPFNTEDLTNIEFGTYTVTITDATGCDITATYSVGALVSIDAEAGVDDTVCVGYPIILDGSGGGDYLWMPSATLSDSSIAEPTAIPTDTTTYYLTVTVSGCVDIDSVTIYTYPIPPVDAGDSLTIPVGAEIGLNANGVVTGWTYTWEPADLLDDPSVTNPVASPMETTTFYVTVVDENGCINSDSVLVEVTPGIEFPDGITPNGDGMNDTWIIDNIDLFDDAIVEVYNRWGQILFQSAPGYPVPWDGRYKSKDLPVGTYYYVITSSNFEEAFTGPITIVR